MWPAGGGRPPSAHGDEAGDWAGSRFASFENRRGSPLGLGRLIDGGTPLAVRSRRLYPRPGLRVRIRRKDLDRARDGRLHRRLEGGPDGLLMLPQGG